MANYDSNYAIAQEISARVGNSPIPFDSVYSICLQIYQELGGDRQNFDSVYSILLEILPLVDGGVASKVIDDTSIRYDRTWSSHKIFSELAEAGFDVEIVQELPNVGDPHTIYFILKSDASTGDTYDEYMYIDGNWEKVGNTGVDLSNYATIDYVDEQIEAVIGAANSDIEGKETIDITFVQTLPQSGDEDQYVIIKGDNSDTLYKYVSNVWVEETPDATKLYFDTENEALYSYVTTDHQFAPVSLVNTIVVGTNLNTNADLKAIKTPGVYSVVQRLHSSTKGDYIKNWTLTVEGIDYDEYERTDSIYQRIQSNYTIQKRTWSSTRATNDGWSSFSTYYAGEIKDSTTSKYYTWSSKKLSDMFADIPQLEAGENIEIADNKINAKGYKFIDDNNGFAEHYKRTVTQLEQELPLDQIGMTDLKFTGAAGATTYVLSGENAADFLSLPPAYYSMFGIKLTNGDGGYIDSVDAANSTVTFKETLDANNALSEVPATNLLMKIDIFLSGSANNTTYSIQVGSPQAPSLDVGENIYISAYGERTITGIDSENMTVTLNSTLDAENAISNVRIEATVQYNTVASGNYSHAEGANTTASGSYSHAEGFRTQATGDWGSHTEGQRTIASGSYSHAEGNQAQASGYGAHAEGESTIASGYYSHSEGSITKATGDFGAHSEGYQTEARGICSHAEGYGGKNKNNIAIGPGSHVEGCMTTTNNKSEHAEGSVNVSHKNSDNDGDAGNTLSSIGCGIYANEPKNAREIMQNGDCYIIGIGGYQGTNTKVQNASIRTLQDVVNGKADTYETATTADIEALFV